MSKTFRHTQSNSLAGPSSTHLMATGIFLSSLYVRLTGLPDAFGLIVSPSMHLTGISGRVSFWLLRTKTYRWHRRSFFFGTTACPMRGFLPSRTSPASAECYTLPLLKNWSLSVMVPFSHAPTTFPVPHVTTFFVLHVKSPKPHAGRRLFAPPAYRRIAR